MPIARDRRGGCESSMKFCLRGASRFFAVTCLSSGLFIGLLLGGCSDSDEEPTKSEGEFVESEAFQGVFRQHGYARVIEVEGDTLRTYDVTSVSCVPSGEISLDEVREEFDRVEDTSEGFSWYETDAFTRYEFARVDALPEECGDQATDPVATFDALYHLFDENYAFFEERDIDWEAARALGDGISASSSGEELMGVFQEMLTSFSDGHVYVFDVENGTGFLGGSLGELWDFWASEYEGNPVGENPADPRGAFIAEMQDYVLSDVLDGDGKSAVFDMLHWGMLDENVGYLDIHQMSTFEANLSISEATSQIRAAMKEVMEDLSSAEAIIIDVRFNQGGYDTIGYEVASFFNDEARVVSQKRARDGEDLTQLQDISIDAREDAFLGPVYLLTSRNTVSAAETFSLAMRELPNVTLVGTRTYGSLSDSLGRLLPNGWLVSLSNEIYQSPDGEIFEAEGVPPDELVEYDEEKTVRDNLDRVLSKAVELAGY